jgi:hypothetical protein
MHTPPDTSTIKSRLSLWNKRQQPCELLLWLFRFARLFNDKRFYAGGFLLESIREIVRAVLEEHDEAKCEENKKCEPKKPAQQRHA